MAASRMHRQSREDEVAEALAPRSTVHVHRDAFERRIAGKEGGQRGELVRGVVAGKVRIVVRDFLEAHHVEIPELHDPPRDPAEIDTPVYSAAPLDVPGDELHARIAPRKARSLPDSEGRLGPLFHTGEAQ